MAPSRQCRTRGRDPLRGSSSKPGGWRQEQMLPFDSSDSTCLGYACSFVERCGLVQVEVTREEVW